MRSLVLLCVLLMAVCAEGKKIYGVAKEKVAAMKVEMVKVLDTVPRAEVELYARFNHKMTTAQYKTLLYQNRKQLMLFCPTFVRLAKLMIKARRLKPTKKNFGRMGHFFGQRSLIFVKRKRIKIVTEPQKITPAIKKFVDNTKVADLPCTDARNLDL